MCPVLVEDEYAVILNNSNWPQTSPTFYALLGFFNFSLSSSPWPFIPWTSPSKGLSNPETGACASLVCRFSSWSIPDHDKLDIFQKSLPEGRFKCFSLLFPHSSSHLFVMVWALGCIISAASKSSKNSAQICSAACGLLSVSLPCSTTAVSGFSRKSKWFQQKKIKWTALSAWLALFSCNVGRCSAKITGRSSLQLRYGGNWWVSKQSQGLGSVDKTVCHPCKLLQNQCQPLLRCYRESMWSVLNSLPCMNFLLCSGYYNRCFFFLLPVPSLQSGRKLLVMSQGDMAKRGHHSPAQEQQPRQNGAQADCFYIYQESKWETLLQVADTIGQLQAVLQKLCHVGRGWLNGVWSVLCTGSRCCLQKCLSWSTHIILGTGEDGVPTGAPMENVQWAGQVK